MSRSALRKTSGVVARIAALSLLAALTTGAGPAAAPARASTTTDVSTVDRLAGADRYETAVSLSRMAFQDGAANVVIVNGASYADAVAAAPAAGALHAPVLPVRTTALPDVIATEITRLGASTALVVGGPSAVSDAVVGQLQHAGLTVARIHGADRYATAAAVARHVVAVKSTGPHLLVASGEGFADALVGGAYGSATGQALLLTPRVSLSSATASALHDLAPASVTVLGGPGVVTDDVLAQMTQYTSAPVTRLDGADRYATATAVQGRLWASAPAALLVTGESFPDALAAAGLGVPVLLTRPWCMPQETADALSTWGTSTLVAVGGTSAVSDDAAQGKTCPAS